MTDTIEIKKEIVGKYLQDFQADQNWLERQILHFSLEKKLEKILLATTSSSDRTELKQIEDLGWWKHILGAKVFADFRLFGEFSDKVLQFIKVKKQELLTYETKGELEKLKEIVINGASEEDTSVEESFIAETSSPTPTPIVEVQEDVEEEEEVMSAMAIGAGAGLGGMVVGTGLGKGVEHLTKAKLIRELDDMISSYTKQLENPQLLSVQKKAIQNTINHLEEAKSATNSVEQLQAWKLLDQKGLLSTEAFHKLTANLTEMEIDVLKDKNVRKQVLKHLGDEDQLKVILHNAGIQHNVDELAETLIKAGKSSKKEAEALLSVLGAAPKLKTLAKITRAIPFLDMVGLGFDVFVYITESREAELISKTNEIRGANKKAGANLHLATGIADAAIGTTALVAVFAGLSAAGPLGWAALGVAAAGITINQVMDHFYFDVRDFYMQNIEDYQQQYRTQLKQAVLQATVRMDKTIPLSKTEAFEKNVTTIWNMHPLVHLFKWQARDIDYLVPTTLEGAYFTLIYWEEIDKFPLVKSCNPNFPKDTPQEVIDKLTPENKQTLEQQQTELKQQIENRLIYVRTFMPNAANYATLHTAYENAQGIFAIEKILADSQVYAKMKKDNQDFSSDITPSMVNEYKQYLLENLRSTSPNVIAKMEKLFTQQPEHFKEIYQQIIESKVAIIQEAKKKGEDEVIAHLDMILQYFEYVFLGMSVEDATRYTFVLNDSDAVSTYEFVKNIKDEEEFSMVNLSQNDIKQQFMEHRFVLMDRIEAGSDATEHIGQNCIYEIAKQLHDYKGLNDEFELIQFFQEEKKNALGLHYFDGWYINRNNRKDIHFYLKDLTNKTMEEIKKDIFKDGKIDYIDTSTETADDTLNAEYLQKMLVIIEQEKSYQSKEMKTSIENEIIQYIQKINIPEGEYIKLPYYLVDKAKKSGIGNVEKYFFKGGADSLVALTSGAFVGDMLHFENISVRYEAITPVRKNLTSEEEDKIASIKVMHQKLENIRSVQGSGGLSHEDELDFPVELEREISRKWQKWQEIEKNLLYITPEESIKCLEKKGTEFYTYFEIIYKGILYSQYEFTRSNDIDNNKYFMNMLKLGQRRINANTVTLDRETGDIKWGEEWHDMKKSGLLKKIKNYKIDGKLTLSEMVKNLNVSEQEIFTCLEVMIESFLETISLHRDVTSDKIQLIEQHMFYLPTFIEIFEKNLQEITNNKKVDIALEYLKDVQNPNNTDDAGEKDYHPIPYLKNPSIRQVEVSEQQLLQTVKHTVDQIIEVAHTVDRGGRRGNIIYHSDKIPPTLESRGNEISCIVEGKNKIKILGFSRLLDIQSGIWLLNLINRHRYTYPNKTVRQRKGFSRSEIFSQGLFTNGTLVVSNTVLKKHITNLSDSEIDEIVSVLNAKK